MQLARVVTWFRIGSQRQAAAKLLFEHGFYIDAAYLGGYVVECALKGFVLAHVAESRRRQFVDDHFSGAKAHKLEYLGWLASTVHASVPGRIIDRLRQVSWSTDLRYVPGIGSRKDAVRIIETGEVLLKWARDNA